MIQVFPAHTRNSTDLGWLKSHKNFSFGDYFDEKNVAFGVMRVCNDDDIAAGRGFGPHPHSDMEIISIVLSGAIKHEDNRDLLKWKEELNDSVHYSEEKGVFTIVAKSQIVYMPDQFRAQL